MFISLSRLVVIEIAVKKLPNVRLVGVHRSGCRIGQLNINAA